MFKNVSIKTKIYLTLTFTSSIFLILYCILAIRDFEKDKLNYIFDTIRMQVQTSSDVIHSELMVYIERMNNLELQAKGTLPPSQGIEKVFIFKDQPGAPLGIEWIEGAPFSELTTKGLYLVSLTKQLQIAVDIQSQEKHLWWIAVKFSKRKDEIQKYGLALVHGGQFFNTFEEEKFNFLLTSNHETILHSYNNKVNLSGTDKKILDSNNEGLKVFEKNLGEKSWIIAKSPIGISDLQIALFVDKEKTLEGVKLLKIKSLFFLIVLFSSILAVSIYTTHSLTATIKKLIDATNKIGQGNFDVKLDINSKDEIGYLAQCISTMAAKIKDLLFETADKARMEVELNTAKIVQATLFPDDALADPCFQIRGHYESASECSGDWWFYRRKDKHLYFMIGDATGHGAGAALVTSAARSSVEIIETIEELSVSKLLNILNRGIFAATKGTKHMTFFLGKLNLDTFELHFANAGHNPPILLTGDKESHDRKTIQFLQEEKLQGTLGRDPHFVYSETQIKLNPNDRLFLFTDGILDILNKDQGALSERSFIKFLCNSVNEQKTLESIKTEFERQVDDYRGGTPLIDDVTFFFVELNSKT